MPPRDTLGRFVSTKGAGPGFMTIDFKYNNALPLRAAQLPAHLRSLGQRQFAQLFRPTAQRIHRSFVAATPDGSRFRTDPKKTYGQTMKEGWGSGPQQKSRKSGVAFEIKNTSPHASYVLKGTGLYGPKRARIYPTSRKYLTFEAYGKKWRRPSVKGQHPNAPLTDVAKDASQNFTRGVSTASRAWMVAAVRSYLTGKSGSGSTVAQRIASQGSV